MYVGLRNVLHDVNIRGSRELITTKQVSFDETTFPLAIINHKTLDALFDLVNQQRDDEIIFKVIWTAFLPEQNQPKKGSTEDS